MADTIVGELAEQLADKPDKDADQESIAIKAKQFEFLKSCELGDYYKVWSILRENPKFDVDCVDILGRTGLRLAVRQQHLDIVHILLDKSSVLNVYESLLLSVGLDHDAVSDTIIRHPKYEEYKTLSENGGLAAVDVTQHVDDTLFSLDVTPLMLAAQRNNFQIVKLLQTFGEDIPEPHDFRCQCNACQEVANSDTLRRARARLNAYRGLSSPAYITLYEEDPFLTAFTLSRKLSSIANVERHFRQEYVQLSQDLGDFVVRLLDRIRNSAELEAILNNVEGAPADAYDQMARLKLALHLKQKKFVAHAYCQRKMVSVWYGHLNQARQSGYLFWLNCIALLFVYPFLAVIYMILPWSKVGRFLRTPVVKFVAASYSYIVFLIMIIAYSVTEIPTSGVRLSEYPGVGDLYANYLTNSTQSGMIPLLNDVNLRNDRIGYGSYIISVWILGFVWQDCKEVFTFGATYYADSWFNILDFTSQALYIASFILRFFTATQVGHALQFFTRPESWTSLLRHDISALSWSYWLEADRHYWDKYDPYIVCEALFSVANVISIWRLVGLFIISERIGPMVISLARMVMDVIKFMLVFSLVIAAFIVGFVNLYWYYNPSARNAAELEDHGDESYFNNINTIVMYVYWGLFGMSDLNDLHIGDYEFRAITEGTAYFLIAVYYWASIIVLINMLIAMMSRSFDIIAEDQDVEWKFSRSKIYMDYMKIGGTLPVPLNLIPTWKSLFNCIKGCRTHSENNGVPKQFDGSEMTASTTMASLNETDPTTGLKNGSKLETTPENRYIVKRTVPGSIQTDETSLTRTPPIYRPDKGNGTSKTNAGAPETEIRMDLLNSGKNVDIPASVDSNLPAVVSTDEYDAVMKKILRRYLIYLHGTGEEEATDSSVGGRPTGGGEELKKDFANLRYEILSLLRHRERQHSDLEDTVKVMQGDIQQLHAKCDAILEKLHRDGSRPQTPVLQSRVASPARISTTVLPGKITTKVNVSHQDNHLEDIAQRSRGILHEMDFGGGSTVYMPPGSGQRVARQRLTRQVYTFNTTGSSGSSASYNSSSRI